jgi:hypothetical protein
MCILFTLIVPCQCVFLLLILLLILLHNFATCIFGLWAFLCSQMKIKSGFPLPAIMVMNL